MVGVRNVTANQIAMMEAMKISAVSIKLSNSRK
jgi:hypothetical protein